MHEDDYRDLLKKERPISRRHPMETAHRAKQFAPFAALKGYGEAIQDKENVTRERVLSEEFFPWIF